MNDHIRPQPGILDIALYEGGKASVHPEKAFEFCLRGFGWLVRHVLEKL